MVTNVLIAHQSLCASCLLLVGGLVTTKLSHGLVSSNNSFLNLSLTPITTKQEKQNNEEPKKSVKSSQVTMKTVLK